MPEGLISIEDPRTEDVRELLGHHLAFARATTPPENVFALEVEALADPSITFFSFRVDGRLLGVGALRRLDDEHAEIKSMHTAEEARGRGIGRALVDHLVAVARERGFRRVSIETGAGPEFAPARALYASAGFEPSGAFGDYLPSEISAYMTLSLDSPVRRTAVADWTKTNFGELRDVSPQDARVQWRFAREALGSPELGVSRFTYDPGARMPWGHRHRVQEEVYVVVAGSGRAKLDDEVVELSTWDVLRVAPAVVRSFEAGPEGLDVICIGGRKPAGGDSERFEDFWP